MEEFVSLVWSLKRVLRVFYRDGEVNFIGIGIALLCVVAYFVYTALLRIRRKKKREKVSPLIRNDVVVRSREIKQFAFYDGNQLQGECEPKQNYWLSSSYIKEETRAYVTFLHKRKPVKIGVLSKDVKTVKLCLGDSPKDTNFFDKLELTQLARYFGFDLRRDEQANLTSMHNGIPLSMSIKCSYTKIFFFIYGISGTQKSKSMYLFGVYEVIPTQRLLDKYVWLKQEASDN